MHDTDVRDARKKSALFFSLSLFFFKAAAPSSFAAAPRKGTHCLCPHSERSEYRGYHRKEGVQLAREYFWWGGLFRRRLLVDISAGGAPLPGGREGGLGDGGRVAQEKVAKRRVSENVPATAV